MYTRALPAVRVESESESERYCLSTEMRARDGNVWIQNYRAEDLAGGMPMLWVHNDHAVVIGRWTDLAVVDGRTGRELHGTPRFDLADDNPDATRIARQVGEGFVTHTSLRIYPGSVESARGLPEDSPYHTDSGLVIGRTESNGLLEASWVPVPSDVHAGARGYSVGLEEAVMDALARMGIAPLPEPEDPDADLWGAICAE